MDYQTSEDVQEQYIDPLLDVIAEIRTAMTMLDAAFLDGEIHRRDIPIIPGPGKKSIKTLKAWARDQIKNKAQDAIDCELRYRDNEKNAVTKGKNKKNK